MAALPNVVCKLSGVTTEADHKTWTRDQLRPYIDHVIECFGPDRILYGGDWPVVRARRQLSAMADDARLGDRRLFGGRQAQALPRQRGQGLSARRLMDEVYAIQGEIMSLPPVGRRRTQAALLRQVSRRRDRQYRPDAGRPHPGAGSRRARRGRRRAGRCRACLRPAFRPACFIVPADRLASVDRVRAGRSGLSDLDRRLLGPGRGRAGAGDQPAPIPPGQNIVLQTTGQNTLALSDAPPSPTSGGIILKAAGGAMIVVNDAGVIISNGKGATSPSSGRPSRSIRER